MRLFYRMLEKIEGSRIQVPTLRIGEFGEEAFAGSIVVSPPGIISANSMYNLQILTNSWFDFLKVIFQENIEQYKPN